MPDKPIPGTYGAIERSTEAWNWRREFLATCFRPEDLIKAVLVWGQKMAENTELLELLKEIEEIHRRKSADYTNSDVDGNFRRIAELQSWFKLPMDKAFAGFVAVKLARLGNLLGGATPNNESLEDSFLDLTTYCALWTAYHKRLIKGKT